jgi:hypothetical protein
VFWKKELQADARGVETRLRDWSLAAVFSRFSDYISTGLATARSSCIGVVGRRGAEAVFTFAGSSKTTKRAFYCFVAHTHT